jgi:hypothetical protein
MCLERNPSDIHPPWLTALRSGALLKDMGPTQQTVTAQRQLTLNYPLAPGAIPTLGRLWVTSLL